MALRRNRGMSTVARAVAIAEQLHHECSVLLELYRQKESFSPDMTVSDDRLLSVPLPSAQLDNKDKLWCLHSALLQCHSLMDRAISKEEAELGSGRMGEYEKQRKMVKDRLLLLLANTEELLKSEDSSALITSGVTSEVQCPAVLFELKLWVFCVFKELESWAKTAISILQEICTEPVVRLRVMTTTSTRR